MSLLIHKWQRVSLPVNHLQTTFQRKDTAHSVSAHIMGCHMV